MIEILLFSGVLIAGYYMEYYEKKQLTKETK